MKLGNYWMCDLVLEAWRQGLEHDTILRHTAVVFLWGTGLSPSPVWPPCLCLEGNDPFQRFQAHIFHFKRILPLWMWTMCIMQVHVCVYIWMCMRLVWGWHKAPRCAGPCCRLTGRVPSLVVILPHAEGHGQWVGLATATDRFLLLTAFRWSDVEARTALGLRGKLGLGAPVCSGAMNSMDTLSSFQGVAIAAPSVAGTALDSERHLSMCLTCFLLWRVGPVASPDAHLYLPTSELNVLLVYADAVTALWVSVWAVYLLLVVLPIFLLWSRYFRMARSLLGSTIVREN